MLGLARGLYEVIIGIVVHNGFRSNPLLVIINEEVHVMNKEKLEKDIQKLIDNFEAERETRKKGFLTWRMPKESRQLPALKEKTKALLEVLVGGG